MLAERGNTLAADAPQGTTPASMHDTERASGHHGKRRQTVGETQENRQQGFQAENRICIRMTVTTRHSQVHLRAMNLVRVDQGIRATAQTQSVEDGHTVSLDSARVIANMRSQVQTLVGGNAESAMACGEGDANGTGSLQGLIGKPRETISLGAR